MTAIITKSRFSHALAALFLAFMVLGLLGGTQIASAANNCMQDKVSFGLNCTANDVSISHYTVLSGPTSCIPGEDITVTLEANLIATSQERYDIGLFVATDGGTALTGICYQDYLPPPLSTTKTVTPPRTSPFYNAEATEDPADTCGDIEQGILTLRDLRTITIKCQDANGDGFADVGSCTSWDNTKSAGTSQKPSCTNIDQTLPGTPSKCRCESVRVGNITVPKVGTITVNKVLDPSTDPGKFNLQIDGVTKAADVGNGGTTGVVTVSAGTAANPGASHTVGEIAGTGTDLTNYNSSISCTKPGLTTPDTDGTITVMPNDAWTCTITNTPKTGSLTITKTFDVGGSTFTSGSFGVHVACTNPTNAYDSTINYPTPGNVTITGIPANSSCTVTETSKPDAPVGYEWVTETITGSPATITAGGTANVTIANKLDLLSPANRVTLDKTNDANHDTTFTDSETVPTTATYPYTVTYKLVITNFGGTGTITSITDDKTGTFTTPVSGLTPTCASLINTTIGNNDPKNCYYDVTFANANTAQVVNTATVVVANASGTGSKSDTSTVNFTQNPHLAITKTADKASYDAVGQVINYTITATNDGNTTLAAVTVTDPSVSGLTCTPANGSSLAPGAKMNCTATHTVTQADIDAGRYANTACVDDGANGAAQVCESKDVTAIRNPAISLAKSANPATYDAAGQTITYSYTITNSGNVTLGPAQFTVSDDHIGLPAGTAFNCGAANTILVPAGVVSCTASYTTTQADLDSGSVTNIATASGSGVTSNQAQATVTATQKPHLKLTKTPNPLAYSKVGDIITYTLIAGNDGNVTLTDVSITDPTLGSLTCNPAQPVTLAPNATLTCTGSYTISQADLDAGKVDNTATSDGKFGTTPVSATASASVTATQTPHLTLVKNGTLDMTVVAPIDRADVGDQINYTLTATNDGNITLSNVEISDPKLGPLTCAQPATLAPGETLTCTGTYVLQLGDINNGKVDNTATAKSDKAPDATSTLTVPVPQNPHLLLTKSASPAIYSKVGDIIAYSLIATNNGNVTLTNVSITDPKLGPLSCSPLQPATLNPGETLTCSGSHVITQTDLDAGKYDNTANASGTNPQGQNTPSDPASVTVTAEQKPAISLVKSADPTTYDTVGQTISYSYVITNSGNVTLAGPFTVADDKATVTCPDTDSLAPGASITCAASYVITQADLDSGKVTNHATAHVTYAGNDVLSNEAQATVTASQRPNLTLTKAGILDMTVVAPADRADVGDKIHYTLTATNTGNVTLTGVTVTDPKLPALSCTPAQPGMLAPGESMTCTGSYTLTQADIDAGSVGNTATGDSDQTPPTDTPSNVPIPPNPALTIDKTASPSTYAKVGDVISYSYLVTNSGNVTLHDAVTVTDTKVTATCPALPTGGLIPGAFITCTASYTIAQVDLDAGSVINSAYATSGTTKSNTDTETVTAVQNPALTIDKTATPSTYAKVGDVISYSYLVTNSGNVTLHDAVTVTDNKATATCPALPSGGLAPGASITCSATYTITQADLDSGSVTNSAYAKSGTTQSPPDSETVKAVQTPALTIDKTASPSTYAKVGDVIAYSYLVTNSGNVTLHDAVTVTDTKATATCPALPAGGLVPGASITCTASYIIAQADLNNGSVTNSAHATSGTTKSNTDTETVTAEKKPALSLVKKATPSTYDTLNQTISYSYTITNSGNVTLSGPFSVNDDKSTDETCPATPASLDPGFSITCTATYKITQADLDFGSVTNKATATNGTVTSNEAQATVAAVQNRSLNLVKTADPLLYDHAGQIITYGYTITNTSNVTLSGQFSVNDDKATVTCTQPADGMLSPNETMTCTASYAITTADMNASSVINKATATNGFVTSNEATATVFKVTGSLQPTQTTCQQFAGGPDAWAPMYEYFSYQTRRENISSIAPGVIFYYNSITAPADEFNSSVTQTNTLGWNDMLIQDLGQAILYTDDCSKAPNVTVTTGTAPYAVNFAVTGAIPGATYYIGIKYSPQNLVGQLVGKTKPTNTYSFSTAINGTPLLASGTSIRVQSKK